MTSERAALSVIGLVSVLALALLAVLLMWHTPDARAMPDVSALPMLNAALNAGSALLLTAGFWCIRRRKIAAHMTCMLGAFGLSLAFLASYVTYHYYAGSKSFAGQGWVRPVYFALLLSHIVLAAVIVPLALTTLYRALTGRFDRHVRLARVTLPLWLYVSVTGVVIYLMLYHG